jgi:hypothetical protein
MVPYGIFASHPSAVMIQSDKGHTLLLKAQAGSQPTLRITDTQDDAITRHLQFGALLIVRVQEAEDGIAVVQPQPGPLPAAGVPQDEALGFQHPTG